jgi:hypothetical protein
VTERGSEQHLSLLPDTQALIRDVEAETGKKLAIRLDASIRGRGRAIYVVSDGDPRRHLVLIDPLEARFADHFIAHETGHILSFHRAAPEERVIPVLTEQRRTLALRRLLPEIEALVRRGIPEQAIAEVAPVWLSGTVAQLADTPADLRIENWIWREFPGLHEAHEASLRHQAESLYLVGSPAVRAVTPTSVWRASNAMNHALIKGVERLLNRTLGLQYPRDIRDIGEELYGQVDGNTPLDLASDRRVSIAWAKRLGLEEWFEWRRLDELPRGFRHAWE